MGRKYILFLFFVLFFFYLISSPPTIYLGDSGEIVSSALTLGISHPPGYPLYNLIGKIFTYIPAGDYAFRLNFMSSLFSALLALMFYLSSVLLLKLNGVKDDNSDIYISALVPVIIYAFSDVVWFEAVNAKGGIYIISSMISLFAFFVFLKYMETKERKYFYLVFYLCGFLPVLHLTSAAVSLTLVILMLYIKSTTQKVTVKEILFGVILYIAAASTPYLYLFIRTSGDPAVHWGRISGISGIMKHITRDVYNAGDNIPFSIGAYRFKIGQYLKHLSVDYWLIIPFLIIGMFQSLRAGIKSILTVMIFILLYVTFVAVFTGNMPMRYWYINQGFYMIADISIVLISVYGLCVFLNMIRKYGSSFAYLTTGLLIIVVSANILYQFAENDSSRKFFGYDYSENIRKSISYGDWVLVSDDVTAFGMLYFKTTNERYSGINIFDRNGNVSDLTAFAEYVPGKGAANRLEIEKGLCKRTHAAIYYTDMMAFPELDMYTAHDGILYKMYKNGEKREDREYLLSLYSIRDYYNNRFLDRFYRKMIARHILKKAEYAKQEDIETFNTYRQIAEELAGDTAVINKNIASIYFNQRHDVLNSVKYLEKAIAINNYDFTALNLLIRIYGRVYPEKAVYWLEFMKEKEWNEERKEKLDARIEEIKTLIR